MRLRPMMPRIVTIAALLSLLVAALPEAARIRLLGPICWEFAAVLVLGLTAFILGSLLLRIFVGQQYPGGALSALEWGVLAETLGLGFLAWITLPLGLILPYRSEIYWGFHIVVLSVAAVCRYTPFRPELKTKSLPLQHPDWVEMLVLSVLFATMLYMAFLQGHSIEGSDGQTNHLSSVIFWQQQGRYVPFVSPMSGVPTTLSSQQYPEGRLLLLHLSLLESFRATGIFNVMMIGLTALGVFVLGSRLFSQRVGRLAVLIYLTCPVLFRFYAQDVTDYPLNLSLFLVLCVALVLAIKTLSPAWIKVALITAGLLFGVKYYSLLQILIVTLLAIPFLRKAGLLRELLRSSWLFLVFAAPWMIHNWLLFANPFFPYLYNIFGGLQLPPSWRLFYSTRRYELLSAYLADGHTSYLSALLQFWYHQIFPPPSSDYAFSPLYVPAIFYWLLSAFRRPVYWLPIAFSASFLVVGLNSVLFNKFMFMIIAPTAPFIALAILSYVEQWPIWRYVAIFAIGCFALISAWESIASSNLSIRRLTYEAEILRSEPFKTLNALPDDATVIANISFMNIRYGRTYIKPRILRDNDELLCDDWQIFFDFYKSRLRPTHYLIWTNERFPYAWALPWLENYDAGLAAFVRQRQVIFEQNQAKRYNYLSSHAPASSLGDGYVLYDLRKLSH